METSDKRHCFVRLSSIIGNELGPELLPFINALRVCLDEYLRISYSVDIDYLHVLWYPGGYFFDWKEVELGRYRVQAKKRYAVFQVRLPSVSYNKLDDRELQEQIAEFLVQGVTELARRTVQKGLRLDHEALIADTKAAITRYLSLQVR